MKDKTSFASILRKTAEELREHVSEFLVKNKIDYKIFNLTVDKLDIIANALENLETLNSEIKEEL